MHPSRRLRVLVCPDKFKDAASAADAARAVAEGVERAGGGVTLRPMADGGEGTAAALSAGGRVVRRSVCGPLPGSTVVADVVFLDQGRTAVFDMASAAGIALLAAAQRDPERTTTYGVGELVRFALDAEATRVIVGLGGSATCDAGLGAAQALGAKVEVDGRPLTDPITGGMLSRVTNLTSFAGSFDGAEVVCLCDVDNPLHGPRGSAFVFAPQKGASPEGVARLDAGLANVARVSDAEESAGRPGAGAAGGLAFGLGLAAGATTRPGAATVADAIGLREAVADADLCITGEGRFDATSAGGKVVSHVAQVCQRAGVPCVVLAGSVDSSARVEGVTAALAIHAGPTTLADAIASTTGGLAVTAEQVVRLFASARGRA